MSFFFEGGGGGGGLGYEGFGGLRVLGSHPSGFKAFEFR